MYETNYAVGFMFVTQFQLTANTLAFTKCAIPFIFISDDACIFVVLVVPDDVTCWNIL